MYPPPAPLPRPSPSPAGGTLRLECGGEVPESRTQRPRRERDLPGILADLRLERRPQGDPGHGAPGFRPRHQPLRHRRRLCASGAGEEASRLRAAGRHRPAPTSCRAGVEVLLPDVRIARTTGGSRASTSSRAPRARCGAWAPTTSICIQCHRRRSPRTPVEETVSRLSKTWSARERSCTGACRSGAPRSIGEACAEWRISMRRAYRPISNQPQYSILRRPRRGRGRARNLRARGARPGRLQPPGPGGPHREVSGRARMPADSAGAQTLPSATSG